MNAKVGSPTHREDRRGLRVVPAVSLIAACFLVAPPTQAQHNPPIARTVHAIGTDRAQRFIVAFNVGGGNPAHEASFTAVRSGEHSVAVSWETGGELVLSVSGSRGPLATKQGTSPLVVPVSLVEKTTYKLEVALPSGDHGAAAGRIAVVYGSGSRVTKRVGHRANPRSPEGIVSYLGRQPREDAKKDGMVPLLVRLTERHLSQAGPRNELDKAFERALTNHPSVSRSTLEKFVNDFKAIPVEVRARHFAASGAGPVHELVTVSEVKTLLSLKPQVGMLRARGALDRLAAMPRITKLNPSTPLLGYCRGQKVSVVGRGFSPTPVRNIVELRPEDGSGPTHRMTPIDATDSELKIKLPVELDVASDTKWMLRVTVGERQSNEVRVWFGNPLAPGAVPTPVVGSVSPAGQGPGQWVFVNGQHFDPAPGATTKVLFTNLDVASSPTVQADAQVLSATQIKARIPGHIVAGTQGVQVLIYGQDPSDAAIYQVKAPRYKVLFQKMRCKDESDPEWAGDDELVTFWAVSADDGVWTKNTDEYTGFEDGTVVGYSGSDAPVLKPDGSWADVKWAMAVGARLYEWDAGDVEATQDFVGFVGEVGGAAVGLIGSPAAGATTAAIAEQLSKAIGYCAAWFGGDPDCLGERLDVYPAHDLQAALDPGQNQEKLMGFYNNDDTGSYELTYSIFRE